MRGEEKKQTSMLVLRSPEDFVPKQHPIRRIKKMADEILRSLSPALEAMYATGGRPSIPPERLLKAYPFGQPRRDARSRGGVQRLSDVELSERKPGERGGAGSRRAAA